MSNTRFDIYLSTGFQLTPKLEIKHFSNKQSTGITVYIVAKDNVSEILTRKMKRQELLHILFHCHVIYRVYTKEAYIFIKRKKIELIP